MPQTDKYPAAKTAEELARAPGLSELEAQQWQVQYGLLKQLRQAISAKLMTDAEIARKAGCSRTRVAAIRSGNLDNVSTALLARLLVAVYAA